MHRASRPATALVALLLVSLPLAPLASGSQEIGEPDGPAIRFSAILPNPDTDNGQVEFMELWNQGAEAVELAGWTIQDRNGLTFSFATWHLAAGARVVVWSGTGATATPEGPFWRGNFVWAQSGDTATLRNATGAVVDWMAYGTGRDHTPPPGFDATAMPDAPPKGVALLWTEDGWVQGEPTPGRSPGEEGGGVSFEVLDVPPRITVLDAPSRVRSGADFTLTFQFDEDNGDPVIWRLDGPGGALATGSGVGAHSVELTAPMATGPWPLRLNASDPQGNHAEVTVPIELGDRDLLVTLPETGAIRFPALAPGERNVTSLEPFTITNTGSASQLPRLDLSPFRNGVGEVPVDGNLHVGVRPAGSSEPWNWVDYDGPYTSLPALDAGADWEVVLRIAEVPLPLPAGTYGTSFTIVEAAP